MLSLTQDNDLVRQEACFRFELGDLCLTTWHFLYMANSGGTFSFCCNSAASVSKLEDGEIFTHYRGHRLCYRVAVADLIIKPKCSM